MNNKIDMNQLMSMLSKMDKKDLESGLSKVSKMLNSKEADNIIEQSTGQQFGKHCEASITEANGN